MTHEHPEAAEYAAAAAELEKAATPAPARVECPDGDHDYEVIDDSFDHEFGCERIVYRRCKDCGHESSEELDGADEYSEFNP